MAWSPSSMCHPTSTVHSPVGLNPAEYGIELEALPHRVVDDWVEVLV